MTGAGGMLRVADLRRACLVSLDAVEDRLGAEVALRDLGVDYYWNVDLRAAFEMGERPEQHLDCGQVSDDLAEVAELLRRRPGDVVPLWHDLQHVAGLLRALAFLDLR